MINKSIQNILYTEQGQIIISIVLGLGLATIFRNYCDGKNCYNQGKNLEFRIKLEVTFTSP